MVHSSRRHPPLSADCGSCRLPADPDADKTGTDATARNADADTETIDLSYGGSDPDADADSYLSAHYPDAHTSRHVISGDVLVPAAASGVHALGSQGGHKPEWWYQCVDRAVEVKK
jgi:hypothetical protein